MAVFSCAPNWKGIAVKGGWQNHESSLTDNEIIELAKQIANIPGMSGPEPMGMHNKFKLLRAALASADQTICITKGIHERDKKVHFDVQIGNGAAGTFHVFVAPGQAIIVQGTTKDKLQIKRKLAPYVPTGLSVPAEGILQLWPAIFKTADLVERPTVLADLEKPVGRPRGYSLSSGNSSAQPTFSEALNKQSDYHITRRLG